jgi:hypothetical protein
MIKRGKDGKFKKGHSGNPNGVPKGLKQRSTEIKEAFFDAFEKTGGVEGLINWVNKDGANRKEFYSFLIRLMPKEVDIEADFKDESICTRHGTSFCPLPQFQTIFADVIPTDNGNNP